jgi:signal transduction histidine kinase/ligand-binding sensor domain-containing protein/CheY-like chemotaxis protein/AraC-like DNA-binding protein
MQICKANLLMLLCSNIFIRLFIPLFLIGLEMNSFSQLSEKRYIKKINSDDGLSHNIVNDIVQDGNGFIWIATQDGLNRFDGYEFRTYRFDPADPVSILGNHIESLLVDKQNNLWISTRYGLNLYDPKQDNFIGYIPEDLEELDITKISYSRKDGLWISNYTGGVLYFDIESRSFIDYHIDNQYIPSSYIIAIHEDRDSMVWIGTANNGVLIFHHLDNKLVMNVELSGRIEKIDLLQVEEIFEDINGNIWIASRQGLVLYLRTLNEFFHIRKSHHPEGLIDDIILDVNQDFMGNIIIGTQEGGLNILSQDQLKANNPGNYKFSRIMAGSENHHLSYRSIQSVFEDKDRNLWLGTFGNGVNVIPQIQPKFKLLKHSDQNPNSLNFDKIWGICEDQDGRLWIGTDGMGLNRYNPATGEIDHYMSGWGPGAISDDAILSALCDSRGRLWFGTYAGGLNLYVKDSDSFRHIEVTDDQYGVTVNDIRTIFESENGDIWLGTNGAGLMRMNEGTSRFTNIIPQSDEISAYDIRAIAQDQTGGLWLGTYGAGLFYYHPVSGEVKHHAFDRINPGTLKCNIIYSLLYDDAKNVLWIGGSQNGGLNRLDLNNLTFSHFNHDHGLVNDIIHGIEKDSQGRLWMSTNEGISMFDPASTGFTNFDKLDGVQEKEFSNGSVLKSSVHQIICFGGSAGLNYFQPEDIQKQYNEIPVIITDLKIYNEQVPLRTAGYSDSPLLQTILYTHKLELNYRQNNFTLGFSGIHYANPGKINYQYKLEPADQDWNNLNNKREVTFQNLRAGEYRFFVRASNADGIWSDNNASLLLSIKPPPWRSWWAFVLYGLIFFSFVVWIYSYNLKQAKMKHHLLVEKQLRSHEHEIYEERIRFFTNISHEIRTPLMLLINPLEDLISKESINTVRGRTFRVMHRSANSLLQLINTLLEFRKTETGTLKLSAGICNIVEQVEENSIAFKGMAARKNIELIFQADQKEIEMWVDREKLEMILNNILSNAIKNSFENGAIEVHVKLDPDQTATFPEGHVVIIVRDEGTGIPADEINKIFDRFYQVKGGNNTSGTGIGLALTKKLVELHRGSITVESILNRGTSFFVRLPLGKTHLTEEEMGSWGSGDHKNSLTLIEDETRESVEYFLDKLASLSPGKSRILIIEDNAEIRTYLRNLLSTHFMVDEAENGASGLEKARQFHPSIIISDIMMPELDGLELCRILKSEFETSHIPILMITANLAHHIHIHSFEVGADAYITKPFKPDLLLSRVYNLLRSREKLREFYTTQFKLGFAIENRSINKDEEFLCRVNELICKHMNNPSFSVDFLHQTLGISRTVFYNKIKSLTGYSPIELIRNIRLRRAADLLSTQEYKVFEAMMEVGFSDEKHFRQLFKKQYGVVPSAFLNSNNEQ